MNDDSGTTFVGRFIIAPLLALLGLIMIVGAVGIMFVTPTPQQGKLFLAIYAEIMTTLGLVFLLKGLEGSVGLPRTFSRLLQSSFIKLVGIAVLLATALIVVLAISIW